MILENYYHQKQNNIEVSRQQASDFAKIVADDFNPLHDIDAKRFCVPGDLLFALVLKQYGLSQHMLFKFAGLVGDGITLQFPPSDDDTICIKGNRDKEYLNVFRSGNISRSDEPIKNFTQNYVSFSGHTFLHVLVPLMEKKQVMINPDRPLIIYESMEIDLKTLELHNPQMELVSSSLEVNGKRGNVLLEFDLLENGQVAGHGKKTMVLSGIRPLEKEVFGAIVAMYEQRKKEFE